MTTPKPHHPKYFTDESGMRDASRPPAPGMQGQPDPALRQQGAGIATPSKAGGEEKFVPHPYDVLINRYVGAFVDPAYHTELQAALPQFTGERVERLMAKVLERAEMDRLKYGNTGALIGPYPGYAEENRVHGYDRQPSPFVQPFIHKFLRSLLQWDVHGAQAHGVMRGLISSNRLLAMKSDGRIPDTALTYGILKAMAEARTDALTPDHFAVYVDAQLAEGPGYVGRIGDIAERDPRLAGVAAEKVMTEIMKTNPVTTTYPRLLGLLQSLVSNDAQAGLRLFNPARIFKMQDELPRQITQQQKDIFAAIVRGHPTLRSFVTHRGLLKAAPGLASSQRLACGD